MRWLTPSRGPAAEPGETALDLFCGAGLFAGVLAEAVGPGGAVVGVEQDEAAVRDARHNLRRAPWARVHSGDAPQVLRRTRARAERDRRARPAPHRRGPRADRAALLRAACRRVAYVSCDPATLARDIGVFGRHGWRLEHLRGFDAFPMTHHVECLAVLVPPAG